MIIFLGMLINTFRQLVMIPQDKITRAIQEIDRILSNKNKKATVIQIQKLCGILNFLCWAIVPGRPFTMRLYVALTGYKNTLKPYHHVRIPADTLNDLRVWRTFLTTPFAFWRPFIDFSHFTTAIALDWFTDSAKAISKGFGGHHGSAWFHGLWPAQFLTKYDPSISYLELYAVVVSAVLWLNNHKNSRIVLFCDKEGVVHMINSQSSRCKNCMVLLRILTLQCMIDNVRVYARHVGTKANGRADALSRDEIGKFRQLSSQANQGIDEHPSKIPAILSEIEKLWIA